jgi:carbon monoxide dehydrogenase subunit G
VEFEHSVHVDAAPEAVWARLTDVKRLGALVPGIESLELPEGGLTKGARVAATVRAMGRRETAEAVVTAVDPGRRLALEAEVPQARARAAVEWNITPDGSGSRVTQKIAIKFNSAIARVAAKALLGDALSDETAAKGLAVLKSAVEVDEPGAHSGGESSGR